MHAYLWLGGFFIAEKLNVKVSVLFEIRILSFNKSRTKPNVFVKRRNMFTKFIDETLPET